MRKVRLFSCLYMKQTVIGWSCTIENYSASIERISGFMVILIASMLEPSMCNSESVVAAQTARVRVRYSNSSKRSF